MLFLDLDGTIVGSANELTPAIRQALTDARQAGIRMAICTGRTNLGLSQEIGMIMAPEGPHIFESGGAIVTMKGERLYSDPIPQKAALEIADVAMKLAETHDVAAEFYTDHGIFVSKKTSDSILHAKALKIDPNDVTEADVREIAKKHSVIRVQWVARQEPLSLALAENPTSTTVSVASAHAVPGCLFASVTKGGVDKGSAVKYVAEKIWNIPLDECYAVGDSSGDVPMLEVVGHPFIMGTATDELKAKYTNIPDVESDGVLEVLCMIRKKLGL